MNHQYKPSESDLPSSSQLFKSTIIAALVAGILLLLVILPAEYGVDPSGIGDFLGLKKMGEIKVSLEKEAIIEPVVFKDNSVQPEKEKSKSVEDNHDITEILLAPNEAIEIKLEMKKGAVVNYQWSSNNGSLNFNLHGDGYIGMHKTTTYKKGRMVSSDKGELIAEFHGFHGWFWRNRNNKPVTVFLETTGNYISIKRIK